MLPAGLNLDIKLPPEAAAAVREAVVMLLLLGLLAGVVLGAGIALVLNWWRRPNVTAVPMEKKPLWPVELLAGLLALACWGGYTLLRSRPAAPWARPAGPAPDPAKPRKPWRPWAGNAEQVGDPFAPAAARRETAGAKVGGPVSPGGANISCDLPGDQQQKNIASKGLGCCVFRSCDHAGRLQNIPALVHFPEWMVEKRIEGGGYPAKVDKLVPQIAADRGLPAPSFVQVEGADYALLELACKTGRMPCVTYSKSPTGRYGGRRIAHMVNVAHADPKWLAILDNNYVGDANYEWLSPDEAKKAGVLEWVLIFIEPSAPPPPHN